VPTSRTTTDDGHLQVLRLRLKKFTGRSSGTATSGG
jgi:hypothetical protein